jgi:ketosteroid isomerase-like protein
VDGGERRSLLERAYERFNARDIDALLAMMSDDVEWPDVAQGQVLRTKDAIRSYWEAQFAVANPVVTPTGFIDVDDDLVAVVDQVVLDFEGNAVVPRATVFHRYSFDGDLVRRMVVFTERHQATAAA